MEEKEQGKKQQELALDTYVKLLRSVNTVSKALSEQNPFPNNLTITQFGVLEALHHLGPQHQQELSEKILKTKGNLSLVLENLEKADLIKRIRPEEDRRKLVVSLTPGGKKLISQLFPPHAHAITHIMSVLTEQEQEQLGRLCRKLGLQNQGHVWRSL
jgi:MarR family 2-MHQ and catechol resistance regulon transcriptional repressor